MPNETYLERLYKKILEHIDVQEKAIAKALELDDPRPFGAHKLTGKERIAYFASLPDEKKMQLWLQMSPEEQEKVRQGMMQTMQGQG